MNRGMNTGTNRRSGALLLELVIALVILTVGLLGIFGPPYVRQLMTEVGVGASEFAAVIGHVGKFIR